MTKIVYALIATYLSYLRKYYMCFTQHSKMTIN